MLYLLKRLSYHLAKENSADVRKMGKFLICLRFDNVERLQLVDYALHFFFSF